MVTFCTVPCVKQLRFRAVRFHLAEFPANGGTRLSLSEASQARGQTKESKLQLFPVPRSTLGPRSFPKRFPTGNPLVHDFVKPLLSQLLRQS